MSISKLRPGRIEPQLAQQLQGVGNYPAQQAAQQGISYAPRPKPAPIGPHQLGNATLTNVETLTNMSADEIDKLANAVDAAAHETSDGLRAFAHKLRATGRIANEQLANFVHVASTCAEAGRHMQAAIEKRDEAPPETAPVPEAAKATEPGNVDLDEVEREIAALENAGESK